MRVKEGPIAKRRRQTYPNPTAKTVERAVLVAVDYSRARHWSAAASIDEQHGVRGEPADGAQQHNPGQRIE